MSRFGNRNAGGGGVRPQGGTYISPGGNYGDRDRVSANQTVSDLWSDYLKEGYFDADGALRSEFVAAERVEPLVREMGAAGLTNGQLRRFFQHCRGLETQLRSRTTDWPHIRPKFEFLAAAAADAYGKQPPKIPSLFHSFIRRNVDAVKSEADFLNGFLPHFEALVGFGSLHLKERN